jgi:hypothetical protein
VNSDRSTPSLRRGRRLEAPLAVINLPQKAFVGAKAGAELLDGRGQV